MAVFGLPLYRVYRVEGLTILDKLSACLLSKVLFRLLYSYIGDVEATVVRPSLSQPYWSTLMVATSGGNFWQLLLQSAHMQRTVKI